MDKWDQDAAQKSAAYNGTPRTTHLDACGNVIASIADNGLASAYTTRYTYDVMRNQAQVENAADRVAARSTFDMLAEPLYEIDGDSGESWKLKDCLRRPMLLLDTRGIKIRNTYDGLGRPAEIWVAEKQSALELLVTRNVYGEEQPKAVQGNFRGKLYQCFDQAGLGTNASFDFKGNCLRAETQFAVNYKTTLDWSDATMLPALEPAVQVASANFDALNRAWQTVAADGGITQRSYDFAGNLKTTLYGISVGSLKPFISNIEYEPDQKRSIVMFGNSSNTQNTYDPISRQLLSSSTWRKGENTKGKRLRDIAYYYDCMGCVTHTIDGALQDVYFHNSKITPSQDFKYDAIGQLVEAHGREQVDISNGGGRSLKPYSSTYSSGTIPGDADNLIQYTETYSYDTLGNIIALKHFATDASLAGWTRQYVYAEKDLLDPSKTNNRLSKTIVGQVTETYGYDDDAGRHGCMTSMPGYSRLGWDFNDRLQCSAKQNVAAGATPETTWYVYNASGTRVRKVTESFTKDTSSTPVKLKETQYLGDCDIYRVYSGDGKTIKLETSTSHVREAPGGDCIALVETNVFNNTTLVRYQVSENLELDDTAQIISYTEYSPFGATTYDAKGSTIEASRRYRFARYERDSETGLYHCGERYYASWLGRWSSPDPIGLSGGINMYSYVGNDPVNYDDHGGTMGFWGRVLRGGFSRALAPGARSTRARPTRARPTRAIRLNNFSRVFTTSSNSNSNISQEDDHQILYRSSDAVRAADFIDNNNVDAVVTWYTGDFNHEPKKAAYFTDDPRSALERANVANPPNVVIQMNVPKNELEGSHVHNYPMEPTEKWRVVCSPISPSKLSLR
jgi:RHS repeat-associated protein